jgi:S1-C subfamily serine protease
VPNPTLGIPNLGAQGYGSAQGVVVTGVSYGSAAWRLGLEPGDRIVQMNNQCIQTNEDVQAILLQAVAYQNGQITVLIDDVRTRQAFGAPQYVLRTTYLDRHTGGHPSGYPNYPDHCSLW